MQNFTFLAFSPIVTAYLIYAAGEGPRGGGEAESERMSITRQTISQCTISVFLLSLWQHANSLCYISGLRWAGVGWELCVLPVGKPYLHAKFQPHKYLPNFNSLSYMYLDSRGTLRAMPLPSALFWNKPHLHSEWQHPGSLRPWIYRHPGMWIKGCPMNQGWIYAGWGTSGEQTLIFFFMEVCPQQDRHRSHI